MDFSPIHSNKSCSALHKAKMVPMCKKILGSSALQGPKSVHTSNYAALLNFTEWLKLWYCNGSLCGGCGALNKVSTVLQALFSHFTLEKSLSGPQCIKWHCNYTVWPLQTLASKPGTLLGGYLYDILLQRHVLWFPVRFNRDILPSSTLLSK